MDDEGIVATDCIFCKIKNKEILKEFTYEDEQVMVFPDIKPVKPIHLLIIPKRHINELIELDDMSLFAHMGSVIKHLVVQYQLGDKGYRVVVNGGGHQIVNHLHIHLMGPMGRAS